MIRRLVSILLMLCVLMLCGCDMRTVDQMYSPPERSADHDSLQTVINDAMVGMAYSAPTAGENQQIVQMADLDGDGNAEYLLYAKGGADRPLHIFVFTQKNYQYAHWDTISLPGISFDKVEYAQIDGKPGLEIAVGTQVSDRLSRSLCVYTFAKGEAEQLITTDYLNFLTVDLNTNILSELFVLRNGPTENDRGIVELFGVSGGVVERSVELGMSEPAANLKRILVGQLAGKKPAVFVASAVDEDTLITDVYTVVNGTFTNVSLSNESGTSVKTMRNYFVYADDIDSDGITELPTLVPTKSLDMAWHRPGSDLIGWYAMTASGEKVMKMYTYHNFIGGWYLRFDNATAENISVVDLGNVCDFYIWDDGAAVKLFTVASFTGQSREEQSVSNGYFPLHKNESTVYAVKLDDAAQAYQFDREAVLRSFYPIHEHWKTGET